ncbi:chromosome segregation ATPase [Methanosarcina sp. T3]|uniref:chromosome segregation ATPase n=1 Tax=Methanosarcina sp. T3 TaxID=3439062 RepID=UPI003F87CA1C
MKKSRIIRYLAYVTFILILFCILPGGSLAARDSSEHGNGVQYDGESVTGSGNNEKDSIEEVNGTDSSYPEKVQGQDKVQTEVQVQAEVQDRISAYKLERKQIQEELQLQKDEYRGAKEDFLEVRNQIRAGKLDSDSEEAVNATRLYLNSSINYMILYLENVKTNIQHSNGNGTEERIAAIDENIRLLKAEQAEVENASSQQEFVVTVRSVRGVWNNSQKASLIGAGQTVSERIGEFLDKSGDLSEKLETDIESLNATGVNTADLETRLTSYKLYLKSAQEKKEAADAIYDDENATRENLGVANNYLRESLNNVNRANQILRVIFDDLKEYNFEEVNEIGVENSTETEFNNTIST